MRLISFWHNAAPFHRDDSSGLTYLRLVPGIVFACVLPFAAHAGMEPMSDEQMSGVSGTGIAVALDDWRFSFSPTSYFEQTGKEPGGSVSFRRGDLRWYGFTMSGINGNDADPAADMWHVDGSACTTFRGGLGGMGCPMGESVADFAPHDNPYILRAFDYTAVDYDNTPNRTRTVLELLAPSAQEYYKFSFLGEIQVDKDGTKGDPGILKNQTIIKGNAARSVLRLFSTTDPTDTSRETLGIFYHSYLQGDFRFSVQQEGTTSDASGVPVVFEDREGFYYRDVDAYLPLGQLYYQALTLDATADQTGNFFIELTAIPDEPNVLAEHYARHPQDTGAQNPNYISSSNPDYQPGGLYYDTRSGPRYGYETARRFVQNDDATDDYKRTHGYVRWGDWNPTNPCPGGSPDCERNPDNHTEDGVFFVSTQGFQPSAYRMEGFTPESSDYSGYGVDDQYGGTTYTRMNLGDARLYGLNMQYLRLTSLGAN